jgi:hypothetical protein
MLWLLLLLLFSSNAVCSCRCVLVYISSQAIAIVVFFCGGGCDGGVCCGVEDIFAVLCFLQVCLHTYLMLGDVFCKLLYGLAAAAALLASTGCELVS